MGARLLAYAAPEALSTITSPLFLQGGLVSRLGELVSHARSENTLPYGRGRKCTEPTMGDSNEDPALEHVHPGRI